MTLDPTPADILQGRAEERVSSFQRGGGPFVAAVEATRMPMVVTDPTVDGNPIVYVNQSFIDLFGHSREEVLGQNYFFSPVLTPILRWSGTSGLP
ncbi:PAS domain-containing protein [Microvirga pakistanensis]|uniref:PAS domain-containing protein n=1 Tax=Microvirga pakistanensis TaxID=1682650 RepID=UPI00106CDF9B|nr:PAS domain-containing protein [Microvirga pakistanensis]